MLNFNSDEANEANEANEAGNEANEAEKEADKAGNEADEVKNEANEAGNEADKKASDRTKKSDITKNAEKILLDLLREKPNVTQKELANITGISRSTIQRLMKSLIKEKKLLRIGSTRTGYWKVL